MTSMKVVQFSRPSPPCPSTFNIFPSPWPCMFNFKRPPSPNINQSIKRKQSKDDYYMLSGPSFRLAFVFSINSLILSGFPMIYLPLAEASLAAFFAVLYYCVCSCSKISQNVLFIISTFLVLILQSTSYLYNLFSNWPCVVFFFFFFYKHLYLHFNNTNNLGVKRKISCQ